MKPVVVVHYHEVGLKGKNRPFFEKKLVENLRLVLSPLKVVQFVERRWGRIVVFLKENFSEKREEIQKKLERVFGISYYAFGYQVNSDFEVLKKSVLELVRDFPVTSFAVRARRGEKSYPLGGQRLNIEIGRAVQEKTGWKVDLENPELTIYLEVLKKQAWIYFEKHQGAGGLPVGVSGRLLCLLSGGLDSPVAAYRMLKRGAFVDLIHFHSVPFTTEESLEKVRQLARILGEYAYSPRLYFVPFAPVQERIVAETPPPFRVILYRRFMARIAEQVAGKIKASALVTGESLAQVASQTLSNLVVIDSAVSIPILRPLIGMDKQEIVEQAKQIGTFEISVLPHEDCCSFLMPPKPRTHSTKEELEEVEKNLDVPGLVQMALEKIEEEKV